MVNYEVDFSDTEGASVAVVPTSSIPEKLWRTLRETQFSALEAQLPGALDERRERAEAVMRLNEPDSFNTYTLSRVLPGIYVGEEGWWRDGQTIENPVAAVMYHGGQAVGAVLTDCNVSYSRGEWELWLKQRFPLTNYLRIREAYVHPDLHRIDTDKEQRSVSGLVVAGVQHILMQTSRLRSAAAYVVLDDPADAEKEGLAQVLGMCPNPPEGERQYHLPGYPAGAVMTRVEGRVGAIRKRAARLSGASEGLGRVVLLDGLNQTT